MKIIVINTKSDFSLEQQDILNSIGHVHFIESNPNYSDTIFIDEEDKIIALGPEVVDWKISIDVLSSIPNLIAVCLPTTNFAWVDGNVLKRKGVVLTNVPKYSTESVAEYAVWMMLGLARKIPILAKEKWKLDYSRHIGIDLRGKTMGVVGLGSIGTRIGEMGQAMGMKVAYWSRTARDERFQNLDLETLLGTADFVFPTLARNVDTANLLNADKLKLLKKESYIVSITGDELFDLEYTLKQVESGNLAGVAFESSGKTLDEYMGNVLATPPIAWFTKEAAAEDIRIWLETIQACAKGQPINVVN